MQLSVEASPRVEILRLVQLLCAESALLPRTGVVDTLSYCWWWCWCGASTKRLLSAVLPPIAGSLSLAFPRATAAVTRLALPGGGCWTVESALLLGTRCSRLVVGNLLTTLLPSGCQVDPTTPSPANAFVAMPGAAAPLVGGVFPGERPSRLAGGWSATGWLPSTRSFLQPCATAPADVPPMAVTEDPGAPAGLASSSSDEQEARAAVAAAAVLAVVVRCVVTVRLGLRLLGPRVT